MIARLAILGVAMLGYVALLILCLNVAHGLRFNSRCLNVISVALFLAGAAAAAGFLVWLGRRPVAEWAPWSFALLAPALATALCGLPAVTIARSTRRIPFAESRHPTDHEAPGTPERLGFIGSGWRSALLKLPGNESLSLRIEDWDLRLPELPAALDDLCVLLLADLHLTRAYTPRYFEWALERLGDLDPDLILFAGDMIDDPACYGWIGPFLSHLPPRAPRFAVLGNHDALYDLRRTWCEVEAAGFQVLDGRWGQFIHRGKSVAVGGTWAPWGNRLDAAARPAAEASILLSHSPDLFYQASALGFDLMFSGHNHAGQVHFPVVGPVLMPSRFSRRFEWGFYRGEPTLMYVSRGLGAQVPLRYGCPPELTRLRFRGPARESEAWGPATPPGASLK